MYFQFFIFLLALVMGDKLLVQDSGMVKFGENDNAMVFFIQVIEQGPTSSRLFVETAEVIFVVVFLQLLKELKY